MKGFVRRSTWKHSRMGLGRRKLQRWRTAFGRHSKIRKNRFGYTKSPRIGFKKPTSESGKINGKMPVLINNLNELANVKKENNVIIARTVGAKKRIEMIKKASEKGIEILNLKKGVQNGSN